MHGQADAVSELKGEHKQPDRKMTLLLGALGVVYGDIGTSPLYAMRECFHGTHGIEPTPENVLGVLSLIIWSLILVVTVKYVGFVLRADNRGEGGILALMALVVPRAESEEAGRRWNRVCIGMGLFGAALLYGDGMITPAISVLSAVEGLEIATPLLEPYVIPLTIVILILLFAIQRHGTGHVGAVFGPIMLVWFVCIALLGIGPILREPAVLWAFRPAYAVGFLLRNGWHGVLVLGSVFLVVTGGEALYADMGHFGRTAIRRAWLGLVLPSLILHYFGQASLLLENPKAAANPFYLLAPSWALYPLVALSTVATVIASQALISGVFSLTHQAVQLGYLPRTPIRHTSAEEMGQIYIAPVNWMLLAATIGLVIGFGSSSHLAAAYGVAVTGTMAITTVLLYRAMRQLWHWPLAIALPITALFLVMDVGFFGANIVKVAHGGWFPLVVGVLVYTILSTWYDGRQLLASRLDEKKVDLEEFLHSDLGPAHLARVSGTAVFLSGRPTGVPQALILNLRHNKVLHRVAVLLTIQVDPVPRVRDEDRYEIDPQPDGIYRVLMRTGFLEYPDPMWALRECQKRGVPVDLADTTFFVGSETMFSTPRPGMAQWREHLFIFLSRNAYRATRFFGIQPSDVVEMGVQIEL